MWSEPQVVAMLLALQLIVGRRDIWLPQRWKRMEVSGGARMKVVTTLLGRIRWLERFSRPRGQWLFGHRLTGVVFGLLVLVLTITAFVAPPFSGLDTLPAIGVVTLSLGILMTDVFVAAAGITIGTLGVVIVIGLSSLVIDLTGKIF